MTLKTNTILGRSSRWTWSAVALAAALSTACGHSEEEWQAQLAKYGKLDQEHQAEKAKHAEAEKQLAAQKAEVAALTKQLSDMGVEVQKAGTEKEQLTQSLEELQAALEEYKRRAAQLERIKERFDELQKKLQKLVNLGLKVEIRHNRMVIRLPGDVLYASGSDKLRKEGEDVVIQVAEVIRKDEQLKARYFQIAGHTDDRPLKGGRFGDNWGLSAMRARTVLLQLVKPAEEGGGGLDPIRLHASGYSDSDPVVSNATPEGREQNRRVELVLMPDVEEMLDLKKML